MRRGETGGRERADTDCSYSYVALRIFGFISISITAQFVSLRRICGDGKAISIAERKATK